jgi:hypothetical protein
MNVGTYKRTHAHCCSPGRQTILWFTQKTVYLGRGMHWNMLNSSKYMPTPCQVGDDPGRDVYAREAITLLRLKRIQRL